LLPLPLGLLLHLALPLLSPVYHSAVMHPKIKGA
jgi:hypothetical protein